MLIRRVLAASLLYALSNAEKLDVLDLVDPLIGSVDGGQLDCKSRRFNNANPFEQDMCFLAQVCRMAWPRLWQT